MIKPVIIFGSGGLAKAALEIFTENDVIVYGFLDDDPRTHGQTIGDINILGAMDDTEYLKVLGDKCDAFVALDDNALKAAVVQTLRRQHNVMPINAIHAKASVAASAVLHHGNFIDRQVAVGAGAKIGNHCILRAGAVLDYECVIGDFVQIGAGATINAGATVGDGVFIGSGAVVVSGVKVDEGARVGAGSLVISDVAANTTVFGNPAKPVQ